MTYMEITWNGKALIVTLLFRLLFGGYIVGMDQYHFNDIESAFTVLLIYTILGIFATLYLLGKRYGIIGIMGLDVVFIIMQFSFIIVALGQIADVGLHDPLANWWATLLMVLFSLLTLVFSIRVYKEP